VESERDTRRQFDDGLHGKPRCVDDHQIAGVALRFVDKRQQPAVVDALGARTSSAALYLGWTTGLMSLPMIAFSMVRPY